MKVSQNPSWLNNREKRHSSRTTNKQNKTCHCLSYKEREREKKKKKIHNVCWKLFHPGVTFRFHSSVELLSLRWHSWGPTDGACVLMSIQAGSGTGNTASCTRSHESLQTMVSFFRLVVWSFTSLRPLSRWYDVSRVITPRPLPPPCRPPPPPPPASWPNPCGVCRVRALSAHAH